MPLDIWKDIPSMYVLLQVMLAVAKPTPLEIRRCFKANVAAVSTSNKYLDCLGVSLVLTL